MEWLRPNEQDVLPVPAHPLQRWVLRVLLFTLLLSSNTYAYERAPRRSQPTTESPQQPLIMVGIIMPETMLRKRYYQNKIREAIRPFGGWLGGGRYQFTYESFLQIQRSSHSSTSSTKEAFEEFLYNNVSAIIYPTTHELFGPNTVSSQNFLQMAGRHNIPVIAWNIDNSGLGEVSKNGLVIQMAPSIHHQAAAMLSILERYEWHDFTIVTTEIEGYTDFVKSIREQVHQYGDPQDNNKKNVNFTIIDHVLVKSAEEDLYKIKDKNCTCLDKKANTFLLYSTHDEAFDIMKKAEELQLTGKNYLWIVTESVVGDTIDGWGKPVDKRAFLPVGMLGVDFETNEDAFAKAIMASIRVFAYGFNMLLEDPRNDDFYLQPDLSCKGQNNSSCQFGLRLCGALKNGTIPYYSLYDTYRKMGQTKYQPLEFLSDGTRKDIELKIVNLKISRNTLSNVWEEVGTWSSLLPEVFIEGIVWPGNQNIPPRGALEKDHPKAKNTTENDETMSDITGRIVLQQCLSASLNFPGETDQSEVLDLQLASEYITAPMATESPQTEHIAGPDTTETIPTDFSSQIGSGMVVFISFLGNASEETVNKLVERITNIRLSEDGTGKRLSIVDVQGDILIVPQATLGGNFKDGSMQYHRNVDKAYGRVLYDKLCQRVHEKIEESTSGNVKCGVYGARQHINMDTNGPFTHIIQV